jgi:hypothetical protein
MAHAYTSAYNTIKDLVVGPQATLEEIIWIKLVSHEN